MPIYEYACKACDRDFEELVLRRSDEAGVRCPACKSTRVAKRISRPASTTRGGGEGGGAGSRSSPGCGPVG